MKKLTQFFFQEILLPLEKFDSSVLPLPSISADLREIKKPVNGLLNTSSDNENLQSKIEVKERKKKEIKKFRKLSANTSQDEEAPLQPGRKTRAQNLTVKTKTESKLKKEVKEEKATVKVEVKEELDSPVESKPLFNGAEDVDGNSSADTPSFKSNKPGFPENKRLIVGVNTINYDASSSVKNKAKVKLCCCFFNRMTAINLHFYVLVSRGAKNGNDYESF